jgi:hypothetical protein
MLIFNNKKQMKPDPYIVYRDVVDLLEKLLEASSDQEKDDIFYNTAKQFYNM